MPIKIRRSIGPCHALLLLLLTLCLFAAPAEAAKRRHIVHASAALGQPWWQAPRYANLVINADTGDVLSSVNANARLHPASLTKMMTLYVIFGALDSGQWDKDTLLTVSAHGAAASPTKLNLRAGQQIRVEDAIKGVVTCSANDAAITLAENFGGSEDNFARIMTQTAGKLGMNASEFHNASGLPNPNQYSSARDMATLALALQKHYPQYYTYFATPNFNYRGVNYSNHNHLMERYEGMDGIKTGYVNASGFNLVSSVRRDGVRLVGVVFGGSSAASRDQHMAGLLDAAFVKANGGRAEAPVYAEGPATLEPAARPAVYATEGVTDNKVQTDTTQTVLAQPKAYSTKTITTRVISKPTLAKKIEAVQVKPTKNRAVMRAQPVAAKKLKPRKTTTAPAKQILVAPTAR